MENFLSLILPWREFLIGGENVHSSLLLGLSLKIAKYFEVRALGSGLHPASFDLLKALDALPAKISWLKVN